jgi:hypothetical protein
MDLADLVGRSAPFNVARDPVNLPMIRHWCDVMGVHNPRYLDPESAEAPIAMLDVWDKPGLAFVRDETNPQGAALTVLDGEGFTSTVAVNSDLEQARPLRLGELVHSTLTLEDISPEKHTGLGVGHFVTSRIRYLVADEVVGSVLFRVLKFKPGTGKPPSSDAPATPPAHEGALPELRIPLTPTLIIGGALMTLDWFDGHHDRDMAVQRGSKDVFMNIHTSLGLVQRYLEDWAGPDVRWHDIRARLGASNYPGDTLVLTGDVVGTDDGVTTVAYRGTNALGAHITGTARLTLP